MMTAIAVEESDVAAVSPAISEWALVWVSVSDSHLPYQSGSMLPWRLR